MSSSTDITGHPDEYGVTLLCTFGEEVRTAVGYIEQKLDGFWLHLKERKPERFATALPAVRKLRKHSSPARRQEGTLSPCSIS